LQGGHDLRRARHHALDAGEDVRAGQESRREQAQLTAGHEDDPRALAAQFLRVPGALLEQAQHRLGRQVENPVS